MANRESIIKHSFESDTPATKILTEVSRIGLNKTMFINRCIGLSWREAMKQIRRDMEEAEGKLPPDGKHKEPPK